MVDDDETGRGPARAGEQKGDRAISQDSTRPPSGGHHPDERAERLAAFDHIAGLTVTFAEVARRRKFETLAQLLDMAHRQACQDASGLKAEVGGVENAVD